MFHFSQYFKISYISKASKGACVESRVNLATLFAEQACTKWLTSTLCTYFCPCQQPFLNQQKEANDRRKYFTINFHESMGLDWDKTHGPRIRNQTHYRLCYGAPLSFGMVHCTY